MNDVNKFTTYGDIAIYRAKRRLQTVAKAIVAVVTPIVTEGAFVLAEELNTADAPPAVRFVITTLLTGLAVYRVKNKPKY